MVKRLLTGNAAAAWGARLADVDYVPAFPITPQTEIIESLEPTRRGVYCRGRFQTGPRAAEVWDAVGAATFGFRVAWINRFAQSEERLPDKPDVQLRTLRELPEVVLP